MTEKSITTIDQTLQMNVATIQELLQTPDPRLPEAIGAMFMVDNNPFLEYLQPNEQLVIPNPKNPQKPLVTVKPQNTPPDQLIKTISWQDFLQRLQNQGLINL